ncbi:MAG: hypothetical protein ABSC22_02015 [Roseiarcus sp.]|jgi:hypothetical protein
MATTHKKSRAARASSDAAQRSAARRPPAHHKTRRILGRLTMGASAANVVNVDKVTIRRVRRIVADALAEREVDPPAGFVPSQTGRLGDAMVLARTTMKEGDRQATEWRRRPLISLFAARSQTGQKTAPKLLTFPYTGHGSACRDLSRLHGESPRDPNPQRGSSGAHRAVAGVSTARKKSAPQRLDIARSPENDAAAPTPP